MSWLTFSSTISWLFAVSIAVLVWGPSQFVAGLGLDHVVETYRNWFGIFFFAFLLLAATLTTSWFSSRRRKKFSELPSIDTKFESEIDTNNSHKNTKPGAKDDGFTNQDGIDYLASFPIPDDALPSRLRALLKPVGTSPRLNVEVASREEADTGGPNAEYLHMLMAVVPGVDGGPIEHLDEACEGVVAYSVPVDEFGCYRNFSPSVSGHDYIVASWGSGSFFTFELAEKVWMTLGLSPRCVGNDHQLIVYDDLSLPQLSVAKGEISSDYYWKPNRNVVWRMSNEYLRRYLWLRAARGVRVFFYQAQLEDIPEVRELMGGDSHVVLEPPKGVKWYKLDIREHKGGLLIQVWASVEAVTPELSPGISADGVIWPGDSSPMTRQKANALTAIHPVYLDDRFLQKYEESDFFDSTPVRAFGDWFCSPSYLGQWSFTECKRVGRNLIKVPMRELYKPKPDREILHALNHAIDPVELEHIDLTEEHIVSKVDRLVAAILKLGNALSSLGDAVGLQKSVHGLTGFDERELNANGWRTYPALARLAMVVPLGMSQQMFLARCKSLHEVYQRIPNGFLKSLVELAGCPSDEVRELGSIKLLQAVLNIVEGLNANAETIAAFESSSEPIGWKQRNIAMAPVFLNNDLRIADAHESVESCLATLREMGFDTASVADGYGRAFDFVIDGVISSLEELSSAIEELTNENDHKLS